MSYRKILVPVFGSAHDGPALQAAFGLGRLFGAHVEVLFVSARSYRANPTAISVRISAVTLPNMRSTPH